MTAVTALLCSSGSVAVKGEPLMRNAPSAICQPPPEICSGEGWPPAKWVRARASALPWNPICLMWRLLILTKPSVALSKATSVGVMPWTLPKTRSSFVRTTRSRPLSAPPRAGNWMSRIAAVKMPTSWSKKGPENRTTPLAMLLTDPVSRSPERP